jgi:predicted Zn-dependent protease with MMP-like domain
MDILEITDEQFDSIISNALDELPKQYTDNMKNVAIVMADDPTEDQRVKLKLRCHETLFGLYEGIPLTKRGAGYNLVLPDKITLFKNPLISASHDLAAFEKQVKHTLWHEIAHHFGLDHDRIHELENKNNAHM